MRILLAFDGSREACAAAQLLGELQLNTEDLLTVLTVVPSGEDGRGAGVVRPPYPREADGLLGQARALLCHTPASVRTEVRSGHVAHEILEAAAAEKADLVVVGACGLSTIQRFLLGSVAERVVRHASCPVLVGRPLSGTLQRVVLGVDDSACSTRVTEWLRRFPLPSNAEVRLVTVLPLLDTWLRSHVTLSPPLVEHFTTLAERERGATQAGLRRSAATLAAGGKRTVTEIRSGDAALGLLQVAEEEGADLIVVGSHGQSATERFLLGSVSEKVLRHAHCSVLIARWRR
jgi:nucleotide-binding universal stress UspA family protein